jgi:hypothetical protein
MNQNKKYYTQFDKYMQGVIQKKLK